MNSSIDPKLAAGNRWDAAAYRASHFLWSLSGPVATVTLNRPERKNPLTFESYAELRDLFRNLVLRTPTSRAVVIRGAGEQLLLRRRRARDHRPAHQRSTCRGCSTFTRMTGDLVKAMRACPQPIVAAVDGVCAGAGAILAMASDLRLGTARSKTAFLFKRVGPRRLRHGRVRAAAAHHRPGPRQRAALHRPRDERRRGAALGLLQSAVRARDARRRRAARWRATLAAGPDFAHAMTKTMLHQEWSMSIDQAIEAEAQAQAICMLTAGLPPRLPTRSSRSRSRSSRGIEEARADQRSILSRLAVLRAAHRTLAT